MPELDFRFASANTSEIPNEVSKSLNRSWRVQSETLNSVWKWNNLPHFAWIDLGLVKNGREITKAIKALASLQRTSSTDRVIFFSGKMKSTKDHKRMVKYIFSIFPNPAAIEIDMIGEPDVHSAISKFLAMRSRARRARLQPVSTVTQETRNTLRGHNLDLRSDRGNLDIKLIAKLFEIDVVELGRLIGKPNKAALSKTPDAPGLQGLLRPFSDIALLRLAGVRDVDFRKWLRSPNDQMEKRAPLDWIREGRAEQVADFVQNALTGQPS